MARDETGVSEVVSFLFAFAMAFVILVTSLYAFQQINDQARELNARAEMKNVGTRVALGVQEAFRLGTERNASQPDATAERINYTRTIDVPQYVQGWAYNVTLDADNVTVQSATRNIIEKVSTFNAAVSLPAVGCTIATESSYAVCELDGVVDGSLGRIIMAYEFDDATGHNKIIIR